MLNHSIMSIITSGSLCGYFTPLASSSKNTISMVSLFRCFNDGAMWTLLTCLCCDFLRDLKNPPAVGPPVIILISHIALFGRSCCLSSSLGLSSDLARLSCLYLSGVSFFTNLCNFPFWISSSICPLSPYIRLCNVCNLDENDNTSYYERWVKSSMASTI